MHVMTMQMPVVNKRNGYITLEALLHNYLLNYNVLYQYMEFEFNI